MDKAVSIFVSVATDNNVVGQVEVWCLSSPFPAGVFNVVTGNGAFGQSLATHPDVDKAVSIFVSVATEEEDVL